MFLFIYFKFFLLKPFISLHVNKLGLILDFSSRDDIFDKKRDMSSLADVYSSYISQELSENLDPRGFMSIGALIIEPGKNLLSSVFCVIYPCKFMCTV